MIQKLNHFQKILLDLTRQGNTNIYNSSNDKTYRRNSNRTYTLLTKVNNGYSYTDNTGQTAYITEDGQRGKLVTKPREYGGFGGGSTGGGANSKW